MEEKDFLFDEKLLFPYYKMEKESLNKLLGDISDKSIVKMKVQNKKNLKLYLFV